MWRKSFAGHVKADAAHIFRSTSTTKKGIFYLKIPHSGTKTVRRVFGSTLTDKKKTATIKLPGVVQTKRSPTYVDIGIARCLTNSFWVI
jgi:hypothetical protein